MTALLGPAVRVGVLVPSSNSNAETLTAALLAGRDDVGVHYTRFRLPGTLEAAVDSSVLGAAPDLLADVEPDAVAFHGTSGTWTGLTGDRELCAELKNRTGAPATTASLAVVDALAELTATRVAVVFPGPASILPMITSEYARWGLEVVATSSPPELLDNPAIARLSSEKIAELARPVYGKDADAIVVIGTNLRAAYLTAQLEEESGLPVIDSAAATLWGLLRLAGSAKPLAGWGRLMAIA